MMYVVISNELYEETYRKYKAASLQIDDILRSEKNYRQRQLEISAIIDGFKDWLIKQGYGSMEIDKLVANLQPDKKKLFA